jgi:hypothetical protein
MLVHFSAAANGGLRDLVEGQILEMEYESAEQDGYHFCATRVWSPGTSPDRSSEDGASTNQPVEEELRFTTGRRRSHANAQPRDSNEPPLRKPPAHHLRRRRPRCTLGNRECHQRDHRVVGRVEQTGAQRFRWNR